MPRPELSTLRYPHLWQGCVGAWCPSQSGATGYRLFDDSGNNNHGTLQNMEAASWQTGGSSKLGLNFDGSNDFVNFNQLSLGTIHTTAAWVYLRYPVAFNFHGTCGDGNANTCSLAATGNGTSITTITYSWSATGVSATVPDFVNAWTHIATVRINDQVEFFYNGIYYGKVMGSSIPSFQCNRIGQRSASVFTNGTIDDFRFYNRPLTSFEIKQLASRRGAAYESKARMKRAYVPGYRITAPSRIQTGSARTIDGTDTESLSRGLVGAWCPSLGASGFRLIDRSGYNNHGRLTNMDPGTDWVPSGGKLALDFDGVNDGVSVGSFNMNTLNNATNFVSFWINPTNTNVIARPIGVGEFGNNFAMRYNFENLEFTFGGTAVLSVPMSNANYAGKWTHVCGVADSSGARMFFNGVQVGTRSDTVGITKTTGLGIGYRFGVNSDYFTGQLDDVRIYNRVLTPSEIRLLYTNGRGVGLQPEVKPKRARIVAWDNQDKISVPARVLTNTDSLKRGLVGHWSPSVSGPQGNRLMDLSGQNNHGTLTNMDFQTDYVPSAEKGGRIALDFDGTNDYATTNLSCQGFTSLDYSAWIYRASSSENCYLGPSKGGNYGPRANLALFGTTTYLAAEVTTNAIYAQVSNSRTGWNHFHYSFSGNAGSSSDRLKLWINGVEQSLTYSGTVPSFLGDVGVFELGRAVGVGSYGTGQMDDIRVWKRRLTPSEIRLLAQSRMPERATPQRTRTVFYSSGLISYLRRRSYNSILGSGVLS